jgi:GH25 family lysozyme M1 (1,4-beta-N-acetylmuramidase)
MKKVVVLLLTLLCITGCGKEYVESSEYISVNKKEFEVFSHVTLYDIISYNGIDLVSDDYDIDTETIGEKSEEIVYKRGNKEFIYKFTYNVIDTVKPRVFSGTSKTIEKGYEGDICNVISYGDNYDGIVNCKIEGTYDVNKIGTYNLKYNLSDSSNNTTTVDVTLTVKEKSNNKTTTTSTKKTYFSDVISKYKKDNNEIGIDVSKWQGDIDFNKVKGAGATFVMMRIGVQKSALGELEIDKYYLQNIKNAKEAGLKVGVYLYSIASSKKEAIEHANWVLKTLDNEKLDLPVVFDWESWSKWNSFKISFHEINAIADSYIKTVKDAGYEGMLYSSKFYLENIWENKNDYPVWLAHYTEKTSYQGKYIMWQLCNNGRIDGINGDVDIDILYH